MCVYVQTVWHYWLSQNIQNVLSMNIEERHPLSHARGHACRRFRAYWWACYRVSWTCNCFHCCWICTTLIQFTLVDFVHRVWHTHSWDKLHSYSNMSRCWMRNEQNPRPLWRRNYTSCWQTRPMANSWRLGWNEWKWSSPPHWTCPHYWTWLDWVWILQFWMWRMDPWTCKDWSIRMYHY